MKFNILYVIVLSCSHFIFSSFVKRSPGMSDTMNQENVYYVSQKKIHFTGNKAQHLKFNVKLPVIMDFAMCVWYKPQVILDNNILFSYGNKDQQLILWKIKKKRENPMIILKISNFKIMEEKLDSLTIGQWHHLCQYWQGSTGLWSLFLNTYIVSFGYINKVPQNMTNWYLSGVNMTASINHPRTKKTLHGEIYGFHLMSTNFNANSLQNVDNVGLHLLPTPVSLQIARNKRQVESIDPEVPESRSPLLRLRNFLKFIRRMISLVTVPVFRFTRRLIQPWTRRFVPSRPTTTTRTPKSTTPSVDSTTLPSSVGNSSAKNVTSPQNITYSEPADSKNATTLKNSTQLAHTSALRPDFGSFDESIVIYESEVEAAEQRPYRNAMNISTVAPSIPSLLDSAEVTSSLSEEKPFTDKCAFISQKMDSQVDRLNSSHDFFSLNSEKPMDAITQLGPHLLFVQFLYVCCPFEGNNVLISWEETKVVLNNVVIDTIEACGNF